MNTDYRNIEDENKASLGCCNRLEKFFVWLINFVLFVIGVAQIGAGAWAWKTHASDWTGSSLPKASIAMGIIVMFISFLGCCGAWKESRCMLWIYAFLLFWLILGQTGAMSVAAVSENYVERFMAEVWDQLDTDDKDKIEDTFKCCSFDVDASVSGWENSTQYSSDDINAYKACETAHADDGWEDSGVIPNCFDAAKDDVKKSLKTLCIIVAAVGGVQILILFMTMLLINGITAKKAVNHIRSWTGRRPNNNAQFGTGV